MVSTVVTPALMGIGLPSLKGVGRGVNEVGNVGPNGTVSRLGNLTV